MSGAAWYPGDIASTNVGRFMKRTGVATWAELVRRSIDDFVWFWGETVQFLGLKWFEPYERVLDDSRGFPFARWFVGGKTNLAYNCVDQHAESDGTRLAIVWEGEDGDVRRLTYADLRRETDALARALVARGIGMGDAVGIFMPMVPETAAAFLAIAKIGAVALPVFSGYAADAVAIRLSDANAKALITVDGCYRRGKVIDLVKIAEQALPLAPSVTTVVVVPRIAGTNCQVSTARRACSANGSSPSSTFASETTPSGATTSSRTTTESPVPSAG